MTPDPSVLVVIDDLIFRSRLAAAAERAGVRAVWVRTAEQLAAALAAPSWRLAIVDLGWMAGDPCEAIRALRQAAPAAPVVAYYPHVQTQQRDAAVAAGCTDVMPRSAFVQRLPELLRRA